MFVAKPVHALPFHDNFLVNQQIGTVFAHTLSLVADWKRSLIFGTHSASRELAQPWPVHRPSRGIRPPRPSRLRTRSQLRPPLGSFQSVCIRVLIQFVPRRELKSHELNLQLATDAHGCQLLTHFLDTTLVPVMYAGVDENFVLVLSASLPDSVADGHSDFTDPKGPLLTPDFHIPQGYQGEALAS